jgi:hypothetical protein
MNPGPLLSFSPAFLIVGLLLAGGGLSPATGTLPGGPVGTTMAHLAASGNASVVGNFSAALGRIVALLGAAGGAILALAWARVALSWFSNDVSKKMQAKDRARDALIGTVIFAAALSGIVWGLAQWVLSGT